MLVWLSVCSEVQVVCIWSSWCHCIPKLHHLLPHLNPAGFTFLVPTYPGCQCLLPDSGFDHPDYPWSSCFMNTICENKTQLSTADKSTALRFVILQTRSVTLSFPLDTTITSLCSVTYIRWQSGTARMPPLLLSINGTDRRMDRRSTVS